MEEFSQEIWDKKIIELNGSILQSWKWGEFQSLLGKKIHRLFGSDFACLLIEQSLPAGKKYLYAPYGPVGNVQNALMEIQKISKPTRAIFVKMEPSRKIEKSVSASVIQPQNIWMLDVSENLDELLMRMKPKHRYNINLAAKRGVVVKEGTENDLPEFYRLLLETARRGNFRLYPQDYYWKMWEVFGDDIKLFIAERNGKILAGNFFLMFSDTVYFLHGGSSQIQKEVMAPFLLHWESIRWANKNGYKYYDFGGIAPNDEERHRWAGITRFKKGFGGFAVNLPGAYDFVFSPLWYNVYKNFKTLKNIIKQKSK